MTRGGTLHQHLPEALGTDRYRRGGGRSAKNPVEVSEGTRLSRMLGSGRRIVLSYHHQGVDRFGDRLVVTARSEESLVQAVEDAQDQWWAIGVQWHPEQGTAGLFEDLVRYTAQRRAQEEGDRPGYTAPRSIPAAAGSA